MIHFHLMIVLGSLMITEKGLFVLRTIYSVNGKISRQLWARLFPAMHQLPPVVVRPKADLKAEGDRLMGIKSKKPTP